MADQDAAPAPQQPQVKLLRPAEVAARFGEDGVDTQVIYRMVRRGYLRAIPVGTRLWIPETEIERLVQQAIPPASAAPANSSAEE